MDQYYKIIFCLIITCVIAFIGLNTGVFWDNITFISQMGNALYENGIFSWNSIPVEHDPGHPPFVATIMALSWHIFDKSLLVSHVILWPFIFGIIWQLLNLCSYFILDVKLRYFTIIFIVVDTTFLSHIAFIDIEVPLLFFTLLCITNILERKRVLKCISLTLLSMVSLRGMMLCAGLFIVDFLIGYYRIYNLKGVRKFRNEVYCDILIYIIAAIPSMIYIAWRLFDKGWLIANPMHMWGDSTSFTSVSEFINNVFWNFVVIGHRYLDFGRIIPILFTIFTIIFKKEILADSKVRTLLIISFFSVSIVCIVSLIIKNNIDHRYFIISFIGINLLSFVLASSYKHHLLIRIVLFVSLLSGSFYVYPDRIAEQWDSTMAHYPYWELRSQALEYMESHHISIGQTATFFPNHSIDEVELNTDKREFQFFDSNNDYILFSNILVIDDDDYNHVMNDYVVLKLFEKRGIRVEIRKRR